MSYIRAGQPVRYVEGDTLVELFFKYWKTEDEILKEYLLKKLAERLNVKLRGKPLTTDEAIDLSMKKIKNFQNRNNKLISNN